MHKARNARRNYGSNMGELQRKGRELMQMRCLRIVAIIATGILAGSLGLTAEAQDATQTPSTTQALGAYQPKFPGDPARSESEAAALGYMRTVIRAQKLYDRKNDKYAASLSDLVHTGNFTRRMLNPDRGDYSVKFHSRKDGYELTLIPKQQDAQHRSFYANEDGVIHADESKAADETSPKVK
jgi:type II secretory pathway pseudopilin PulG